MMYFFKGLKPLVNITDCTFKIGEVNKGALNADPQIYCNVFMNQQRETYHRLSS